ncbi:M23 family metallopeptidase [Desulfurobacterium thermolithotrophum]|uniref:M23 family metallopeptidase n=1 Tax=Desulfurobacterium thermolithotrophum TaxID=64160 RepID=UPI003984FBB7
MFFYLPAIASNIKFYIPTAYPGSIGYFVLTNHSKNTKVVVAFKGKKYEFPVVSEKAYFAIPYGAKGTVAISLKKGKKNLFLRLIPVKEKKYRISRIWVKERKLTKKLIERIKKENIILRKTLTRVTSKKFRENRFYSPLKKLTITTPFGAKRIINGKKRSIHWGIDLKAPLGTPVFASLSGRVVLARDFYYTGNTIIIDHGLGIYTLYAHLSKLLVKEGQIVRAGQKIGKVGSTGRSTGPHLHFGIYVNGIKVDPILAFNLRSL